jgi:hypothetical protein
VGPGGRGGFESGGGFVMRSLKRCTECDRAAKRLPSRVGNPYL